MLGIWESVLQLEDLSLALGHDQVMHAGCFMQILCKFNTKVCTVYYADFKFIMAAFHANHSFLGRFYADLRNLNFMQIFMHFIRVYKHDLNA
jgi:hypothetical protein